MSVIKFKRLYQFTIVICLFSFIMLCSAEKSEVSINSSISNTSYINSNEIRYYYNNKKPDILPNPPSNDWIPMEEPKEGDWLYSFKEEGETFKEYKENNINRFSNDRNTIYLLQIGLFNKRCDILIKKLRKFISIYYQCKCKNLKPINIPLNMYNKVRKQYDADSILIYIKQFVPDNAIALLGVISDDLYVQDLNFVFGLGSLKERVSIFSLNRYFTYDVSSEDNLSSIPLLRALKTACHEIGHVFSMKHCTFYNCLMNGSNSLNESDRRSIHLCPVCLEKMKWNIEFDIKKRYRELEDFFINNKLYNELTFVKNRLDE